MTLCISPEGELLVPGTGPFYDRIGYKNPDFDASDYVVRNMGFVSIARASQESLRVRFRPALLTGQAIQTTCEYLGRQPAPSIEMNYLENGEWFTESWANDALFRQRLVTLCSRPAKMPAVAGKRVRMAPLELQSAAQDYGNPLKPLLQKWRVSFGVFDDTTMPFLLRFGFTSKLILVAGRNAKDALRFQFIGEGIKLYDEKSLHQLIGEPLEAQPDKEYGAWATAQYKTILQENKPRLDYVEARVQQKNQNVRQTHYERLALPWRSASGGVMVSSASVLISEASGVNDNEPPSASGRSSRALGSLGHELLDLGNKL